MEDALRHLIDSLSACKEGKILNLAAEAYKELKTALEEEFNDDKETPMFVLDSIAALAITRDPKDFSTKYGQYHTITNEKIDYGDFLRKYTMSRAKKVDIRIYKLCTLLGAAFLQNVLVYLFGIMYSDQKLTEDEEELLYRFYNFTSDD